MAMSGNSTKGAGDPVDSKKSQHPNMDELLTLADLAGIKTPGNCMKVLIELTAMHIPPTEVHHLLRDIISSRKRSSHKHSSKRIPSSDQIQENSLPKPPSVT